MTNPLPPEAAVYAACKQHLQAVCVIGHRQPFAFMVVELLPLAELVAARKAVAAAVVVANLEAATYSRIAAEHVLWAATPLPTSVKGNVLRAQVEEQYAEDMSAIVGMSAPAPFKKVSASVSLETVLALAARTAGGAVDADAPLLEAGLDSLGAVELRNQLQQALGEGAPALPSTLVFDHPTARQLAAFFEAQDLPALLEAQDAPAAPSLSAKVWCAAVGGTVFLRDTVESDAALSMIRDEFWNTSKFEDIKQFYGKRERMMQEPLSAGFFNSLLVVNDGIARNTSIVNNKEMIHFSSFDYLGYSGSEIVAKAAKDAIDKFGTSVSASRLVSGEKSIHRDLEHELATLHKKDAAMVFSSGHHCNETVIGHLFGRNDL